MKIILATGNKDKVKEIKEFCPDYNIYSMQEIVGKLDIIENGTSFKENALIKAQAIYEKICKLKKENEYIVLSDDSGICVDALNGEPGIYSARYSRELANDADNRKKLIEELNKKSISQSQAHYVVCIAVCSKFGTFTAHGLMYGKVINKELGNNGFGYDFMFIPAGYEKTIGQLSNDVKLNISHRSKGLSIMKVVLKSLEKKYQNTIK